MIPINILKYYTFCKLRKYKVIFVDYFDTVCFRRIHSFQMHRQWVVSMLRKYPCLESIGVEKLVSLRNQASSQLHKIYTEPSYSQLISCFYDLVDGASYSINKQDFISASEQIETAVEIGTQYANKWLVEVLRKLKEDGKKIYLVSDFHLGKESYSKFLVHIACEDLFDGVFISADLNKSKRRGDLYQYVIRELELSPSDVVMIGDSKTSDVFNARTANINAYWYFPFFNKIKTNYRRITNYDFSRRIIEKELNQYRKRPYFEEYVVNWVYFSQTLRHAALNDNAGQLAFLARGGYFLKKIFDKFQYLTTPAEETIITKYCINSRRVNVAAKNDTNAKNVLTKYMCEFLHNDKLYVVDEGWNCSSQKNLTAILGIDTIGYYIGTIKNDQYNETDNKCIRKGLVFSTEEDGTHSKYYGILRSNLSMYEQMLTSSDGSLVEYDVSETGDVVFQTVKNDMECYLYETYIGSLQKRMLIDFEGLTVWQNDQGIKLKQLAKIVLRMNLFANHKRCLFLNDLDKNMFSNLGNPVGAKVNKYKPASIKDARINPVTFLFWPDAYAGMFCKLQRKLDDNVALRLIYYPFGICYYFYTYLLTFVLRK